MQKLHSNSEGFTHHLLFIVIIVFTVGLMAFSGRRVWVESTQPKQGKTVLQQNNSDDSSDTSGSTAPTTSQKVTVPKTGTAAATLKPSATQTSPSTGQQTAVVNTKYPIKSPEGSINQLIKELLSGNFSNALLFITPGFMQRTADLLQANQQYVTLEVCKANATCNALLNTPVDTLKAADVTITGRTSSGTASAHKLTYYIRASNNTYVSDLDKLAGDHTVVVDMVPTTTHWLVDKITIDGVSI